MTTKPNTIDGRFHFHSLIGAGGMGEVWRGVQQPLGRPVAIKLLRRELTADGDVRRRFAREARAASVLNHQNTISLYDFGLDPSGQLFIAMELVDGPSLATIIERRLPLTARQLLDVADQILAGLAHAHARGVVHRDLKPDNIVFAEHDPPRTLGIPKIVDFGIAAVTDYPGQPIDAADADGSGRMVLGTPRYMSPEQALGSKNLSPRTDLYNVGLLLHELITGEPLFGNLESREVMEHHAYREPPPMLARDGVELHPILVSLVRRALQKQPHERWASAGEMRDAIAEALAGPGEPVPRVRTSPRVTYRTLPSREPSVTGLPVIPRLQMVGRQRERATIEAFVERAVTRRRGGILLIEGEAGVGKSRLVNWARERVEEDGSMRANFGAFTPADRSSLRGIREVFETIFRTRELSRSELEARVARRLREWNHESPEDRRAIIDFLRPESDVSRPPKVARLFATLTRIMAAAASSQPRLVVLEDLHWAGPEAFDFIEYLAVEMRQRELPVVLAATFRSEDLQARRALSTRLAQLSRYVGESLERLELGKLDDESARALVESVIPVTDDVARIVLERSAAVPLHTITLLRYLQDEGILHEVDGRWTALDKTSVRRAVPPDLGDLFDRRIDQAESREETYLPLRELLNFCVFCGARFDFQIVAAMVSEGGSPRLQKRFEESFDRLVSDEFITADEAGGDAYTFTHTLLRDWLLSQVQGEAWRQHHTLAATAMESVPASISDSGFDIAWHWREAGDWRRAVDWYRKTARVAESGFAPRRAAKALRSAVKLIDQQLGIDTENVHPFNAAVDTSEWKRVGIERADLLESILRLGNLYEGFGEFGRAERAFRRIVVQVGQPDAAEPAFRATLAHAWLGIGHVARQRGDLDGARWAFERVLELARQLDDDPTVFERASRGLARICWLESRYDDARKWAESALESARQRAARDAEAVALWILGDVERIVGNHDLARTHYEESLSRHRDSGDKVGIARNLQSLAQLARHRGELDVAADLYRRAHDLWKTLGHRRGAGVSLNGLGDIDRFRGRHAEALGHYETAVDIFSSIGATYDLAVATTNLAINAIGLGQFAQASAYLDEAHRQVADQSYPYLEAGIEFHRALVAEYLHGGASQPADAPVPELDYALPLEQMARLRAEKGDREEALELWQRAREIYVRLDIDPPWSTDEAPDRRA